MMRPKSINTITRLRAEYSIIRSIMQNLDY